jgi:hypothetical protein
LSRKSVSILDLAHVIGLIISYSNAADHGFLHYRHLEKDKIQALRCNQGDYKALLKLSEGAKSELQWWVLNAPSVHLNISHGNATWILHTDASQVGWGAYCVTSQQSTSGVWSEQEREWSINAKELKAALLGISALGKELSDSHVQIRSDNTTTVAYINHMGGIKSYLCDAIARELWAWAIERNLWISSTHIPGHENTEADRESRLGADDKEWELNSEVLQSIFDLWGIPEIDLFASRVNHKVPVYVSWKPDPNACHIDAFSMSWSSKYTYAFPPFSTVGKVIQKTAQDGNEMLLIVPEWPTAAWFSMLATLLVDCPVRLPRMTRLLHRGSDLHPLRNSLRLMACRLSGDPLNVEEFHKQFRKSSWRPGGRVRRNNMNVIYANGPPIVMNEISIPFLLL